MPAKGPVVSCNIMIRDLVREGRIEEARKVFDGMPVRNTVSWNSIIMGHSSRGRGVHVALKLFLVMPGHRKDAFTWTISAGGLARAGRLSDSLQLLKQSPLPHPEAWAAVVAGAHQNGFAREALMIFKEMLSAGVTAPVSHSFTSAAAAAADLSALSAGRQIFSNVLRRGLGTTTLVANSVISMFAKCGSLDDAIRHFNEMPRCDLATWNAVTTGFGCHGRGAEAISAFHRMQAAGFRPDWISFIGVLLGCSRCGYVDKGREYFESMERDFGVRRRVEHYACLIDLFVRAGMISEAVDLVSSMPIEAASSSSSAMALRALLNGCRMIIGREGEEEARRLLSELELDGPEEPVEMGRGRRGGRMRGDKEVGYSWVEVQGRRHLFTARDETHLETQRVYMLLASLAEAMAAPQHEC